MWLILPIPLQFVVAMDYTDILLTCAELGVTIAGFSSLATLLIGASSRRSLSLHSYRFEGMLVNSLLVILFALLPILIGALGFSDSTTWRISSAALLLVSGTRGFMVTYRTLKFKKAGHPIGKPFYIMTALLVAMVVSLGVNVTTDLGELAGGFYLVGLFSVLANACVLFLLVFLAALHEQTENTGSPTEEDS